MTRRKFICRAAVAAAMAGGLPSSFESAAARPAPGKSVKKGVCGGIRGAQGLAALKARWFYTWGAKAPAYELPAGVEWIPQIFPHAREDITKSCERVKQQDGWLLGFNEPDHPGQANMTVERAVAEWPILEKTGMNLVSPAVTWAPNKWMKDFMAKADGQKFRIDAVGIHWYADPNASAFMKYLRQAHETYGRPIWITEFAVTDKKADKNRPNRFSARDVADFLREVLPQLEQLDWVQRYCWYVPHHSNNIKMASSMLLNPDLTLTGPGQYFSSL